MKQLQFFFENRPEIAGYITLGSIIPSLIDNIIPICQLLALIVGMAVGVSAFRLNRKKIKEIDNRNNKYAKK